MANIAILGAGLFGRCMALALSAPNSGGGNELQAQRSHQVTLFDKDAKSAKNSAAYLAAAMLSPIAESADASQQIMQMGQHSLKLWPQLLNQLKTPVFFQQQGSILLAFQQDLSTLNDFKRRLKSPLQQLQTLDQSALSKLESDLSQSYTRFAQAVHIPGEGQLDNRQLLQSLEQTLLERGIVWHEHCDAEFEGHRVLFDNRQADFDWVIDCRGLGAQQSIKPPHQLRGVRGEVLRLYAPDVHLTRPVRLMHPRYPIYIAPKQNHQFVVGATQIESQDQRQPTVKSALELLSSCFSVHRGFAEAEILEIRAGLRPALQDNEPKIIQQGNSIQVNGLFRHGYLLTPALVQQCLTLIEPEQAGPIPVFHSLIEHHPITQQTDTKKSYEKHD